MAMTTERARVEMGAEFDEFLSDYRAFRGTEAETE